MHEMLEFLARHGSIVVFGIVLAEQLGVPLPALPVLLGAGALAGLGRLDFTTTVIAAVTASLIADTAWFAIGRAKGQAVLGLLCRISLEPDSCTGSAKRLFRRLGVWTLVAAKFVPGLSTVAPPLAGATLMPIGRFLWADTAGSLVWSGTFLLIGSAFRHELELATAWALTLGARLGLAGVLVLAAYIGLKYWQRRRFFRSLRVARVEPSELYEMMQQGTPLTVVDLRNEIDMLRDNARIPGAVWIDRDILDRQHGLIPRDRDIILYCT